MNDSFDKQFPAPSWLIEGLVPQGTTLLCGKPKTGKSFFAMGLSVAIATSGQFLGKQTPDGCVLYLSLEDGEQLQRDRCKAMLGGERTRHPLTVAYRWPRTDAGGLDELDRWLEANEVRLVVVDTLIMSRGNGKANGTVYAQDYEAMHGLRDVCRKHGASLIIVHHARKAVANDVFDTVSGTLGLNACADNLAIITRRSESQHAKLCVTGREVQEQTLAISWNGVGWVVDGRKSVKRVTENDRVIDLLAGAEQALGAPEIAGLLNRDVAATRVLLSRLLSNGEIAQPSRGLYSSLSSTGNIETT